MVKSIITTLNEWLARIEFWWAKKTIVENRDYTYDSDFIRSDGTFVVELLRHPWENVIVQLGGFRVDEVNGNGRIDFTTRILYNINDADVTSKQFNKFVTDIVRIILINSVEKIDAKDLYDEDGNANIVESNEERSVSEEVAAVPEKRVPKRKPRKKTVSRDTKILPKVQQPTKSKRTKSSSGRQKRSD